MNREEYIRKSIELHLFFDRIMKEHSFFLEAAFLDKDKELKKVANDFQRMFSSILKEVVSISNGNVSRELLESDEIVTDNTLRAEKMSSNLSGINIDTTITEIERSLRSGRIELNSNLESRISSINKKTLPMIANLIYFKEELLKQVLSCNLFTNNYPLLLTHITNEAKMYYKLLKKVEDRNEFSEDFINEQELFWDDKMKEHAEFIRGLLDPTEEGLIDTANGFANDYKDIIDRYSDNPNLLLNTSLKKTLEFKDFKIAGVEGILNCEIKSIIIPLLADHVLREANHFLRLLKSFQRNSI